MKNQEIIEQIRKISLFGKLSEDALQMIAEKAAYRKLGRDEVLMKKGAPGNSLFLIHNGWVKIVTEDSKGGELILNKCGPGEAIGEMSLIDGGLRSASAVALEDVDVLELDQRAFQDILEKRPDVSLAVMQKYSERLRFATTYIEKAIDWSQKTAEGDYSFIDQTQPMLRESANDDAKAAQLLAAFFQMVRKVKAREEELKQQVERLTFEIDQSRRKQEFEEITSTEFYANLKAQAKALREKRAKGQG